MLDYNHLIKSVSNNGVWTCPLGPVACRRAVMQDHDGQRKERVKSGRLRGKEEKQMKQRKKHMK